MFIAKAALRLSVQCLSDVSEENRKARGNWVGKPIDVRPLAEVGRKSKKSGTSSSRAQPPFEPDITPLVE